MKDTYTIYSLVGGPTLLLLIPFIVTTSYLSNYLNKMSQKIKQLEDSIIQKKTDSIMVEKLYL